MTQPSFWYRFARLNAPFVAETLRLLADEAEALWPGTPVLAILVYHQEEELLMGAITKKDTDPPFTATVSFLDAKGSPTTPDDVPQWASGDESIITVQAADDGMSATITPGSPGASQAASAQVTVTSTDTDGTVVTAVGTVTITSGEASVGDVEFN